MIPYFKVPVIHLFGSFSIHPFALLIAFGVFAGYWLVQRRAAEVGIARREIRAAVIWAVAAGFTSAHVIEILFYHPELIKQDGLSVFLKIWEGMSSFGGLAGGVIGLAIYFKLLDRPWLIHAEILLQGLIVGWVFGRLGCTLAHDHIGRETTFFLAFDYPGGPRHNLGFYEFLLAAFVLLPVVLILHRYKAQPITSLAVISFIYAPVRFGLDFLRIANVPNADPRYGGLTAAQFGCIVLFCFALAVIPRVLRKPSVANTAEQFDTAGL